MKFGFRKPSLKRSLKARTTGRAKRAVKKALIPGYGKKGMGWLKNPQKALYNKAYHKTTFGVGDLLRFSFSSKKKRKTKNNATQRNDNMKHEEEMNVTKTPFYKKKWFLILISVFVPVISIVFIRKSKNHMNKFVKIILTAVASFWSIILLALGLGSGETAEETSKPETTTQAVVEEATTAPVESTTMEFVEESTTAANTTKTAEESTTASTAQKATTEKSTTEKTTAKQTTTQKATTTAKPTTTKKETTTTKKETTTAKQTTTKKVTTTVPATKKQNGNASSIEADYVLNKNSKVFHDPTCESVDRMKEANKEYYKGSRQDVVDRGYKPCGNCHP